MINGVMWASLQLKLLSEDLQLLDNAKLTETARIISFCSGWFSTEEVRYIFSRFIYKYTWLWSQTHKESC